MPYPWRQSPPPLNNVYNKGNIYPKNKQAEINNYNIFQIFILASVVSSLLWLSFLQLCNHVKYATFNTDLCTRRKAITKKLADGFWSFFSPIMLGFLFCKCPDYPLLIFINFINPSYGSVVKLTLILTLKFRKILSWTIFNILSIYIYSIALTPATCILCFMVFQMCCHSLILLSNDIHLNPGPHFQNHLFNVMSCHFMSWNLNSLAKDNFQRIRLIEAHNTLFKYDLISICETSLNDSVELPLINDYTFVPANNPANVRHGGGGGGDFL